MTAERGYGKTEGLAEEAKAEREIIRAQPLSHMNTPQLAVGMRALEY